MTGEKTEMPTPKKLRDARKKGNVLKSQEVVTTSVLLGGIVAVAMIGASMPDIFNRGMELASNLEARYFSSSVGRFLVFLLGELVVATAVGFTITVLAAILGNLGQIGFLFSTEKLSEGFQKLDIVANAKNLFSKKTLASFLFNILKVFLLCLIAVWVFLDAAAVPQKIYSCGKDVFCGFTYAAKVIFSFFMIAILAMVPVSILDWFVQRNFYLKDLKMSKDEVKREYKEAEGSPEIKGQRRQAHQELLSDHQAQGAKSASVIVKNPTHFAVGLRYAPSLAQLPIVVVKGQGAQAERILKVADREAVPVVENVLLARSLFDACDELDFIPSSLVEPVAKIVRFLYTKHPDRIF